jgi:outer membrane protein assembly factor BamB
MIALDHARRRPAANIDLLEPDGNWCPMAHCNRLDDSFQQLPPLRQPRTVQRLEDARVSPYGFIHLGSFTGERMAVCTYAAPSRPALAAYDYRDGSTLWLSPLEDLPGLPRRIPSGVLIARMARDGGAPRRVVFAANPAEFVAYRADGTRLWKKSTREITPVSPNGIGIPISISFTDSNAIVAATSSGWIVKLDPTDGRTIDAYRMTTFAAVDGRLHPGTLVTMKSPIVIGDVMYLLAEFRPDAAAPLPSIARPVYVVRIELSQPSVRGRERTIRPITSPTDARDQCPDRAFVGVVRGRGSPPALVCRDGRVLIFAHAHTVSNGRLWPVIAGIVDDGGVLRRRWVTTLDVMKGDSVHSAPALHAASGTLLVTTYTKMFAFSSVGSLSGSVPSPSPLAATTLMSLASSPRVARVGFGSPFALTFDADNNEIVAYTNFRAFPNGGVHCYGYLGAFAVPLGRRQAPRPLWSRPLGFTAAGRPIPSPGTFGQPALFRYDSGRQASTGLIVNTVYTGTYMIK